MALPTEKTPSPLEGVSITRFQGKTYPQESVFTTSGARDIILPNNPNRLDWIMINESASDVRISNDPNINAATGWLLVGGGGVMGMDWEDDGEGVGYEVFAYGTVGAEKIRVREVIRS